MAYTCVNIYSPCRQSQDSNSFFSARTYWYVRFKLFNDLTNKTFLFLFLFFAALPFNMQFIAQR